MRLAEKPAGHAVLPQMIAKRDLADADGKLVPAGPVAGDIAAGIGRHAASPADRRLDIGVGEADTARGHPVEIGGVQGLVSGAAQIVEPQLVIHDEKDFLLGHGFAVSGVWSARFHFKASLAVCQAVCDLQATLPARRTTGMTCRAKDAIG